MFVTECEDGDLRLVGGSTSREGNLEICLNNTYGAICDDFWDSLDARVACLQLGFTNGSQILCITETNSNLCFLFLDSQPLTGLNISQQSVFFNNVQCGGNEESLLECINSIREQSCGRSDGAGVRCEGTLLQC